MYKCYWCGIELVLATEHGGNGEILLCCPDCDRFYRFDQMEGEDEDIPEG